MLLGKRLMQNAVLLCFTLAIHSAFAQQAVSQADRDRMEAEINRKIAYTKIRFVSKKDM